MHRHKANLADNQNEVNDITSAAAPIHKTVEGGFERIVTSEDLFALSRKASCCMNTLKV